MEAIDEAMRRIVHGRRWIVAFDVSAAAADTVERLRRWGASDVLVVSATEGLGDQPAGVLVHHTRSRGATIIDGIRAYFRSIAQPAPELARLVDEFDPDGAALVLAPPFASGDGYLGRRLYGGRRIEWTALEDKTTVDRLWDEAGVRRAPRRVVAVTDAAQAAADVAGPLGTVWVADNKQGWHGGGDYVRWVPDPAAAAEAAEWFADRADLVRVMPFLDGLPCSIHGFVTASGAAAFRPVEMVVLRRLDRAGFVYAGPSTFWDPPADVRESMRGIAVRVGQHLARRVGYLGPFSVDGVCSADGFLPTELNPRLSAGIGAQTAGMDIPLEMMTMALIEGDLDIDAEWLERRVVDWADSHRVGGMGLPVDVGAEPASTHLRFVGGVAQETTAEAAEATMEIGPAPTGGFVRMRLLAERVGVGGSSAPYAVAAAALAATMWGITVPPLAAALDRCSQ
jgi:hypothetical protein